MNLSGFGMAIIFTVATFVYGVDNLEYSISQRVLIVSVFMWGVMAVFDYVQMKIPIREPNSEYIRRLNPIGNIFTLMLLGFATLLLVLMVLVVGVSVITFADPWHVIVSVVAVLVLVRVFVTLVRDSIKAVHSLTKRKEYA